MKPVHPLVLGSSYRYSNTSDPASDCAAIVYVQTAGFGNTCVVTMSHDGSFFRVGLDNDRRNHFNAVTTLRAKAAQLFMEIVMAQATICFDECLYFSARYDFTSSDA